MDQYQYDYLRKFPTSKRCGKLVNKPILRSVEYIQSLLVSIIDIQYYLFDQKDIPESKRAELKAFGKRIVEQRTKQFLVQNW